MRRQPTGFTDVIGMMFTLYCRQHLWSRAPCDPSLIIASLGPNCAVADPIVAGLATDSKSPVSWTIGKQVPSDGQGFPVPSTPQGRSGIYIARDEKGGV
jgi:hypothetical protein